VSSAITVKFLKTVDSIGKKEIDSLTDDPFFTYGWLKTLETSIPIDINPLYLAAYQNNELVAFAPCFLDTKQFTQFLPTTFPFITKIMNLRKKLLGQNYVLLFYSPFCYRTKIFLKKNFNSGLLMNALHKKIEVICGKEKILFNSFQYVSEFDKKLLMYLENFGYRKFPVNTTFYLDVNWQNFEDYVLSLNHETRNRVRREIKSCQENGVTIEQVSEFKHLAKILSDLSSNLLSKYNKNETRLFTPSFYENLSNYAKDRTILFIAKKNEAVIGFTVCLRHGETLDVFHAGFNYELQKKTDFTYFNVAYYGPISWAIRNGVKKMYYRMSAEDVKRRRGCKPEKSYSLIKYHNPIINSQITKYSKIKKHFRSQ
jgi:predicted N-acyltransferase